LKQRFVGGVSTTSRIEGLHAKQKTYLTSNCSLQHLFQGFRSIEKVQINNFQEEYSRHRNSSMVMENVNSLSEIQKKFFEYIYKKVYPRYCKELNCKPEIITRNTW